jgi:hypothetical protein
VLLPRDAPWGVNLIPYTLPAPSLGPFLGTAARTGFASGGSRPYCLELSVRASPPIVPNAVDRDIYLAPLAQVWRETNEAEADCETLIRGMLDGQYEEPVQIVAFNTSEGRSRDVTEDIAYELHQRCIDRSEIPVSLLYFLEEHGR